MVHDNVLKPLLSEVTIGLLLLELRQAALAPALLFGQEIDVLLSGLEFPGGRQRAVATLIRRRRRSRRRAERVQISTGTGAEVGSIGEDGKMIWRLKRERRRF